MLTVFQCMTLEGWTDVWYYTSDAVGRDVAWIYFITLICLGAFLVLNLVLGVISGEYSKEGQRVVRARKFRKFRKKREQKECLADYVNWMECTVADVHEIMENTALASKYAKDTIEGVVLASDIDGSGQSGNDGVVVRNFRYPRVAAGIKSKTFTLFIMVVVLINTIFLAMDHAGQSKEFENILRMGNITFVSIFVVEMLLKMWVYGPTVYWSYKFNRFDTIVVLISVLEEAMGYFLDGPPMGLSVFRSVRLLRLLKYTSYWNAMSELVDQIIIDLGGVMSLLGVMQVLIIVFALLGMPLFGGKFDRSVRSNFDNFFNAYMTVFQILTGENWNEVMYNGIDAFGGIHSAGALTIVYFLCLVIFGNYVVLNIFLAIAVESLETVQEKLSHVQDPKTDDNTQTADGTQRRSEETNGGNTLATIKNQVAVDYTVRAIPQVHSFGLFAPETALRRVLFEIVSHAWFDRGVLAMIAVSSIALAVEDPVDPDADVNAVLFYFDVVCTGLFTLEMLMMMVALGVYSRREGNTYLRSGWNVLDMLVVLASLASVLLDHMSTGTSGVGAVRVLRVVRVLRPLRSIHRIPKLKQVVECLLVSLKNILSLLLLTAMFTFLFAIVGVQLLKGSFHACSSDRYLPRELCEGNYSITGQDGTPINATREWTNAVMNFDNSASATHALFAAGTTEGWVVTLYNAVDAVADGAAPQRGHDPGIALLFLMYMTLVAFYIVALFVGYVIVTFRDSVEDGFADSELDKTDRECIRYIMMAHPRRAWQPPSAHRLRTTVYNGVTADGFEKCIAGVIVVNLVVLMMAHNNMSAEYEHGLYLANCILTGVYTVEALLKMYAFTFRGYVDDKWNVFDAIIVVGSIIDAALEGRGVSVAFLRLFRIFRLMKLMKRGRLKRLLFTFIKSFLELPYVAMLLGLIFFLYAVVGMQVFGRVQLNEELPINSNNNFQTFPNALGALFRCATGEDWQLVTWGMHLSPPHCNPDDVNGSTCGSAFASVYMISFVFFFTFVVLNLFVAVIIDNFEYLIMDPSVLTLHALYELVETWTKYDSDATKKIHRDDVVGLLRDNEPPLGVGTHATMQVVYGVLVQMDIPIDEDGRMDFRVLLLALYKTRRGTRGTVPGKQPWVRYNKHEIRDMLQRCTPFDRTLIEQAVPVFHDNASANLLASMAGSTKTYFAVLQLQNFMKSVIRSYVYECRPCSKKYKTISLSHQCACIWRTQVFWKEGSNWQAHGELTPDETWDAARKSGRVSAAVDTRHVQGPEQRIGVWQNDNYRLTSRNHPLSAELGQ